MAIDRWSQHYLLRWLPPIAESVAQIYAHLGEGSLDKPMPKLDLGRHRQLVLKDRAFYRLTVSTF